jgi:ABC-2 type transport system permease protein
VNMATVWAIARKDLATVLRNRGVRIPLLITPAIVLLLLPMLLILGGGALAQGLPAGLEGAATPFDDLADPETLARIGGGDVPPAAAWGIFVLEVFLAPLFLLVPRIVATVIAADSFAGERERGTLEALLHTPTTDRELLTAKFLASWLPAVFVSLVGFALYSLLANGLMWQVLGRIWFPTGTWLLLAFWVAPAIGAVGLGIMVIASSRVQSLQAAHQIGSLVVLPIILLLVAQITGLLLLDNVLVVTMGALLWLIAYTTILVGGRSLRRQRLAERL